ncbi:MAG: hypothetical protein ACN6OP_10370 [Pseudomonadales bacterium]
MLDAATFIQSTPWWAWLVVGLVAVVGIIHEKEVDENRRALQGEWRLM